MLLQHIRLKLHQKVVGARTAVHTQGPQLDSRVLFHRFDDFLRLIGKRLQNGRDYFFTDEAGLSRLQDAGRVIELRSYQTVHGIWNYFTVDDGQVDLAKDSYLLVGTLESYRKVQAYYGLEQVIPIYVEVEDGLRLSRAVERERAQREPKYAELCRRFLADEADFSEEKLSEAGIVKRFQNDDLERCLQEIFREITKLEGDE